MMLIAMVTAFNCHLFEPESQNEYGRLAIILKSKPTFKSIHKVQRTTSLDSVRCFIFQNNQQVLSLALEKQGDQFYTEIDLKAGSGYRVLLFGKKVELIAYKGEKKEIAIIAGRMITISIDFIDLQVKLLSPSDTIVASVDGLSFLWTITGTNNTYQLQIDNDSTFFSPIIFLENLQTTNFTLKDSLPDGQYYWRVRAIDSLAVPCVWSISQKFSVLKVLSPPLLYEPGDGSVLVFYLVVFEWNVIKGATAYHLQISRTSDFDFNLAINDSSLQCSSYSTTLGGGTFYWHVRAQNRDGIWGTWSDIWHFSIKRYLDINPVLFSPTNGSKNVQNPVHFDWSSGGWERAFELEVYSSASLVSNNLVFQERELKNSEYDLGISLPDGIYYWRVRGRDSDGDSGNWSDVWNFSIESEFGKLKWKFQTGHYVESSPAIGKDGTIYIGSRDYHLYAIEPNGVLKWKFKTNSIVDSSPSIDSDGTIYVFSNDGFLYALNPTGSLKWKNQIGVFNSFHTSTPSLDKNGTIYIGSKDGYLYKFNKDGAFQWKFKTGGAIEATAVGSDGTIFAGSWDHYLYALNPNGNLKWKHLTDNYIRGSGAIAIDVDGTIYVKNYGLTAITPNGSLKWIYSNLHGTPTSPSIGNNGTIYIGSLDNNLYAIDKSGRLIWNVLIGSNEDSNPAIGNDGMVYVGTDEGVLCALDKEGKLKWKYKAGDKIVSSPAISNDGTIYFGSLDHYIYAIKTSSSGIAISPWPKFRHDNMNTGIVIGP